MLPLSEIDVPRTERSNEDNIGTAVVIEGGKAQELGKNAPPAPRKATLQDLIQSRGNQPDGGTAAPAPAPVRRARTEPAPARAQEVVGRSPQRNVELAGAIRSFLFGRGITSVEVLQGPSLRRPLVVFSTGTEGQVFKALAASATALLHVRDQRPGEVDAFEVVLNSPAGGSAGRFTITPQMAQELATDRIEMPAFYVKYVQF
jgi:hypothetical protein